MMERLIAAMIHNDQAKMDTNLMDMIEEMLVKLNAHHDEDQDGLPARENYYYYIIIILNKKEKVRSTHHVIFPSPLPLQVLSSNMYSSHPSVII
jgi:hypothetical protein